MEFRFRAKDERLFPSNPIYSSDNFLDQALQVSYTDFKNLLPGGRSMEELQKELLEEKIRGEIIAQRIMQKRMLEEEARRNFESNHKMSKNTTDDHQSSLLVDNMGADVAQRLSCSPVIEESKEMPMKIESSIKNDFVCQKRKFSTTSEETREVKRQKMVTEWGCALCHFSAASEDAFKEHIKDQNHITNLSKLGNGSRKATEHNNNEKTLTEKAGKVQETKEIKAAKKTQEAKEKGLDGGEQNCNICGVSVTSKSALVEHEKGKKHLAKAAKFNPSNNGNDISLNGEAIVNIPESQVAPKKLKNGEVKEAVRTKDFYCALCNINCFSEGVLDSHLKGKKHVAMAQKMSLAPAINVTEKSSNEPEKNVASDKANTSHPSAQAHGVNLAKVENTDLSCILCDIRVTCKLALQEHQRGKKHLANVMKKSTTNQKGNGCNKYSSLKGKAINTPVIKEDMKSGEIHDVAHQKFLAAEYVVSNV